ncbi:hypothetical protein V8G54_016628 [Vigna mungo]|uniref:Uncharacterized protein n=1 Tax=Vigna mungo TaxID=3915 RepID=A0AAQ3NPE7_VIGMU
MKKAAMRYNSGFVVAFSKIEEIINSCPIPGSHYFVTILLFSPSSESQINGDILQPRMAFNHRVAISALVLLSCAVFCKKYGNLRANDSESGPHLKVSSCDCYVQFMSSLVRLFMGHIHDPEPEERGPYAENRNGAECKKSVARGHFFNPASILNRSPAHSSGLWPHAGVSDWVLVVPWPGH